MFCFTCSGYLAIGMLGAVLVYFSVKWGDCFLSPALNLCLSNRVFVFYQADRPCGRAVSTRTYPPNAPTAVLQARARTRPTVPATVLQARDRTRPTVTAAVLQARTHTRPTIPIRDTRHTHTL